MKIVTVNVPERYLQAIEKLIGEDGLYPSRSELIRCAVREFLLKELRLAKNLPSFEDSEIENYDKEKYVRIPVNDSRDKGTPISEFKTYKIIRKLEF
ncbi:MAG: ribbon-helix-helix protein, CopG family [Promethearchaeota archaeon]|nr:MAG: ribbon-helix-helix protein, CopG family [Candidatus Lokiarchaeota archaeon]